MGSHNRPKRPLFPPLFFQVQHAGVSSDTGPPVEAAKAPSLRSSPCGFGLDLEEARATHRACGGKLSSRLRIKANYGRPAGGGSKKWTPTSGSILLLSTS